MPSPPPRPATPPPEAQEAAAAAPSHPLPSPLTGEPLAKRARPNPGPDPVLTNAGAAPAPRTTSPRSTLPFDPAHPATMSGSSDSTGRPSLPSMAALMSPDPNASGTLPVPPNTAAFPPSTGGGAFGLGLGPAAVPVPPLQIKLLVPGANAPTRGSAFAAGYDVYSAEATSVPKGGRKLVNTGFACAVPAGTYARIAPRSGLAVKHGIATGAGVVDEDYRGEVKILLFNHGEADFPIAVGDRIAQMVLERIVTPEIKVMEQLDESVRGAGGFGSTGGFGGQS